MYSETTWTTITQICDAFGPHLYESGFFNQTFLDLALPSLRDSIANSEFVKELSENEKKIVIKGVIGVFLKNHFKSRRTFKLPDI